MPPPKTVALALAGVLVVLLSAVAGFALTSGKPPATGPGATTAFVPSASPSASPTPSPQPSASKPAPTPTPSKPPAVRFAVDSFVTVVTDGLRVRTKPGVGSTSLKLDPLLQRGDVAFVINGPVAASGYNWYLVAPMERDAFVNQAPPPRLGWVAGAAKDGSPWLKKSVQSCGPTVFQVPESEFEWPPGGLIGLDCLGAKKQKFVAGIGLAEDACDLATLIAPRQFKLCGLPYFIEDTALSPSGPRRVPVVIDPSVHVPDLSSVPAGSVLLVTVTGQYDHPSARTCRSGRDAELPLIPREVLVLACRGQFVVTSLAVVADQ